MRKELFFFVAFFLLFPFTFVCAEIVKQEIILSDDEKSVDTLSGPFRFSSKASPGDVLITKIVKGKNQLYFVLGKRYSFLGRTGDKNFELELTTTTYSAPIKGFSKGENTKETQKLNVFFEKNGLFHLTALDPIVRNNRACSENDKIFLKMISLSGNELECQVILPKCLIP